MKIEHTSRANDLVIVGMARRTSQATAATDIPAFWQDFMQNEAVLALPRQAGDPAVYAVYCDYEGDGQAPYTMVLGVALDRSAAVPAGMRRVRIPHGKEAHLAVEGDPREQIWRLWAFVNGPWEERGARRFIADYERYPAGMQGAEVVVGLE